MDVSGKKALVFGGTSGIGLATALRLQRLGADVTVISRDPSKHKNVPEGLKVLACNVLDRDALQKLFAEEAPFDILVSAATGGLAPMALFCRWKWMDTRARLTSSGAM